MFHARISAWFANKPPGITTRRYVALGQANAVPACESIRFQVQDEKKRSRPKMGTSLPPLYKYGLLHKIFILNNWLYRFIHFLD